MKRTPIKARRSQPRRRTRDEHPSLPWDEVRVVIFGRSGGRCEQCGRDLNNSGMDAHHRQPRRTGPDCPCNALALCPSCHTETHAHPLAAKDRGAIIRDAPWESSVSVWRWGRVVLGCDGSRHAVVQAGLVPDITGM